jgi:DNA-binding CsgD family transcriptional regulator/tetratricopeptide (TPR) repeat protein
MRAAPRGSTIAFVNPPTAASARPATATGNTRAMASRVTSSTFVGRAVELAELQGALVDAAAGHPSLAFVAGDSGVGKTRLVGELAARAKASGARVLSGDCVELGEGELPYAPIVAALRALARAQDPILRELPPAVRAELATLLPELADTATAPRGDSADAAAQSRLFEALLSLLGRLGDDAPLLLVIEDLHWADRATRAFLAFLGRSLCRERVLVVCTYRPDELHRRHPLRPLLAELEREPRARRIDLPPFTRDELAQQLRDILGADADEDLVDRVFLRSQGHPLFVEELLAAGLDGRSALPPTLRDALMVRIERLSASAQQVLRVIAVGQRLDDELLAAVTELERPALHAAIRDAVANHIVAVNADARYGFRHALLREVVDDDLLPGERSALDLALAAALEARAERDGMSVYLAAGIAHHYASAGDQPAGLRASVRAADMAEGVHAYGQAAALLERAIDLFDRVPEPEARAGADRVTLLQRASTAHQLDGNSGRQEALARAALALVDERTEPHKAARLLEQLADAEWHLGRGEEALATTEYALSLLPEGEVSRERAALLGGRAKRLMLRGLFTEAIAVADETLALTDALGDRGMRGRALNALGTSLVGLGRVDDGVAALREALALAHGEGGGWHLTSAYLNLADSLYMAGRLREAQVVIEEAASDQRAAIRHPWLAILRAELATEAGEWHAADEILASVQRGLVGTSLLNLNLRRAELALGRGDHPTARAALDEIAPIGLTVDEPQFTGVLGALRAELARREGDLDAARRAVQNALERFETCTDDAARLARLSAVGATVEADAAQRARDLGECDAASAALAQADVHVARAAAAAQCTGPPEVAWLLAARAERTRASGDPVPAAFAAAALAWDELERPYSAAVLRLREAEAHVHAGDRDAAAATATAVREVAARLDAGWLLGEVDGLAARARLYIGAEEPEPHGAQAADADPFGLTPRERQVLELVARGATNREIGASLYMAEKTASVHVSRILAKLDVRSRTEAAGVAHRMRLTG